MPIVKDSDFDSLVPGQPPGLPMSRRSFVGATMATGFALGERITIRRNQYTVVGLVRRMVSSSGDPMVFIPLKDAQEAQLDRKSVV